MGAVLKVDRAELVAAVEAAYGKQSASAVAGTFGLTRNAVIGIWGRGRTAGRVSGLTVREIHAAKREVAPAVTVAKPIAPEMPADLAPAAVEPAPTSAETRARTPKRTAPRPVPPVGSAPVPDSVLPARPVSVLSGLTGAAAAYRDADPNGRRTCRWPHGDPRDADFRFCGEVVAEPVVTGRDGQARPQAYCEACREKARPARQVAPIKQPSNVQMGYAARLGTPRTVGAGGLRFGRAAG